MLNALEERRVISIPLLFEGVTGPLALPGLCLLAERFQRDVRMKIIDWQGKETPVEPNSSLKLAEFVVRKQAMPCGLRLEVTNEISDEVCRAIDQLLS